MMTLAMNTSDIQTLTRMMMMADPTKEMTRDTKSARESRIVCPPPSA